MTKITEKTLIPLSLVISIVGGVFWLTTMWADTQANALTIEKIEFKQEKFSRAVVDKLDDIKDRLARIEERQKRDR